MAGTQNLKTPMGKHFSWCLQEEPKGLVMSGSCHQSHTILQMGLASSVRILPSLQESRSRVGSCRQGTQTQRALWSSAPDRIKVQSQRLKQILKAFAKPASFSPPGLSASTHALVSHLDKHLHKAESHAGFQEAMAGSCPGSEVGFVQKLTCPALPSCS